MLWCNQHINDGSLLQHHQKLFSKLIRTNNLYHCFFYGPIGSGKYTLINLYLRHIFNIPNNVTFNNFVLDIPSKKKYIIIKQNQYFKLINFAVIYDKYVEEFICSYLKELMKNKNILGKKHIFFLQNVSNNNIYILKFLKYAIEKYSHNITFIISSCKNILFHKLESFFITIRIPKLAYDELYIILNTIHNQYNKKKLNKKTVRTIINETNYHLSNSITLLQLNNNNKYEFKQYLNRRKKIFVKLYKLVLSKQCIDNVEKFRQYIYDYYVIPNNLNLIISFTQYLLQMHKHKSLMHDIIHIASSIECNIKISKPIICYESFLIKLNLLFNKQKS